ncbi:MAG: hypothetical protein AB7G11_03320 [Phycisphaerales bacterium]
MSTTMVHDSARHLADPPVQSAGSGALTREQLVDAILSMNRTASVEYLSTFSNRALALYLEHLRAAAAPRGRTARWVRPDETPAMCMHECED